MTGHRDADLYSDASSATGVSVSDTASSRSTIFTKASGYVRPRRWNYTNWAVLYSMYICVWGGGGVGWEIIVFVDFFTDLKNMCSIVVNILF